MTNYLRVKIWRVLLKIVFIKLLENNQKLFRVIKLMLLINSGIILMKKPDIIK